MRARPTERRSGLRAQSNVVGVVLLVGFTVVAVGTLTATVGTVVESGAASADVARVERALADAVGPRDAGRSSHTVRFAAGRLRTVDRDVRLLDSTGTVAHVDADAVVFERGDHRTVALAGAVLRGTGDATTFQRPPAIGPAGGSRSDGAALVVDVTAVSGTFDRQGGGGVAVALRTRTSHERRSLGRGRYRVAVETATPAPWAEYFRGQGATVERRDVDGDGLASVVAAFGDRTAHLVVHRVEVQTGAR